MKKLLLTLILFLGLINLVSANDDVSSICVPDDRFQNGFEYTKKNANEGDVEAQFFLGFIYSSDFLENVPIDFSKAYYWLKKSAESGYSCAQLMLGNILHGGFIDDDSNSYVDINESFKWYKKAASQGLVDAQATLGLRYEENIETSGNKQQAIYWYTQAADQGHKESKERLLVLNKPYSIAIAPFEFTGEDIPQKDVTKIISDNLTRSGHFEVTKIEINAANEIDFDSYKKLNHKAVIFGKIDQISTNVSNVYIYIYDVNSQKSLYQKKVRVHNGGFRRIAHFLSDKIYEVFWVQLEGLIQNLHMLV